MVGLFEGLQESSMGQKLNPKGAMSDSSSHACIISMPTAKSSLRLPNLNCQTRKTSPLFETRLLHQPYEEAKHLMLRWSSHLLIQNLLRRATLFSCFFDQQYPWKNCCQDSYKKYK
ncbi:hypothetical protein GDO81_024699 [Engystomops pustulosus]|uniref:Uncharacterized protein n=1 Tax=Engystomops pustulosus TaxID=76066 RepID=A0AAV6YQT0_ENGPU|nr:hypothetical protein GDO81_024699 [Engystomops pustulosus]